MSPWRFASLIGSLTGARLAGAALGFAVQIVLARALAPAAVGTVMLGMSLSAFFGLAITGGYPALGVTALARYHSLSRQKLVRAFLAAELKDTLILGAAGAAILALVLLLVPMEDYVREAILFGALAAAPHALMRLNNVAANSLRRFSLSFLPDFTIRPALLLGAIFVMIVFVSGLASWHVLLVFALINLVVAIGQAVALGPDNAIAAFRHSRRTLAPALRRRAAPLALVALVSVAYGDLVTMVAALFLAPGDVAVVGVAIRIAALAGFVTQSLQQFVLRDLTAALAKGDNVKSHHLLRQTNLVSIGLILAAIVVCALFGELILGIFGEAYRAGKWALVLFLASQLMRAAGGMNMHLLSLGGRQGRTAFLCLISVIVLLALAAALVPHWGVLGLAMAVVAADAVWAVGLGVLARRDGRAGDIFAAFSRGR